MVDYRKVLEDGLHHACLAIGCHHNVVLEKPKDAAKGDYACTAPMQLARVMKRAPRDIAEDMLRNFTAPDFVEDISIAGAGFINIRLTKTAKTDVIAEVLGEGEKYGQGINKNETILLEYVSANPTGPLHVGHGRAAAFGDSLANILKFGGWDVWREYYINDTGRQATILAASAWLRCWIGKFPMPDGTYKGDYLIGVADKFPFIQNHHKPNLKRLFNNILLNTGDNNACSDALIETMREYYSDELIEDFSSMVVREVLAEIINKQLDLLSVKYDGWFSENTLHKLGKVSAVIYKLQENCPISLYEKEGVVWFRSTDFGDDKDRVLQRANGQYTYFAADVAYHYNKFTERKDRNIPTGNNLRVINVLGADHHGYEKRITAAMRALGYKNMETKFIQFVSLIENGKRVKMSTREGNFITLSELINEVGADAARYFYLSRKNDHPLDFDLELAKQKNRKNPVYYAQYAHARIHQILAKGCNVLGVLDADYTKLVDDEAALLLCEKLMEFPHEVKMCAEDCVVHPLVLYVQNLASAIHNFYEKTHILSGEDKSLQLARFGLLIAAKQTMAVSLGLLGVSAPDEMYAKEGDDA